MLLAGRKVAKTRTASANWSVCEMSVNRALLDLGSGLALLSLLHRVDTKGVEKGCLDFFGQATPGYTPEGRASCPEFS